MGNWTLADMPDLSGKTILVTGANSGLGLESAKAFASKGAEVIMACRNTSKGEVARESILKENPSAKLDVVYLDLMDLNSIKETAQKVKSQYKKLDVLLNNAGIMTTPFFLTKDGYEAQFATNHLGHFALTSQLFDLIKSSPNARIVNVSSIAHKGGIINFGDVNYSNGTKYSPIEAYRRSKIANLYFTFALDRKIKEKKLDIKVLAAHPGVSNTNLGRHVENKWWYKLLFPVFKSMVQEPDMGALPQIRASVDESAQSTQYYGPDGFNKMKGHPVLVQASKDAYDINIAERLWNWSEELCGLEFVV